MTLADGRAIAAVVDAPGCRPLLVISTYLHDGQGASAQNRAILGAVGRCIAAQGRKWQVIVGGDFNM